MQPNPLFLLSNRASPVPCGHSGPASRSLWPSTGPTKAPSPSLESRSNSHHRRLAWCRRACSSSATTWHPKHRRRLAWRCRACSSPATPWHPKRHHRMDWRCHACSSPATAWHPKRRRLVPLLFPPLNDAPLSSSPR
jgi:hypothetical protein